MARADQMRKQRAKARARAMQDAKMYEGIIARNPSGRDFDFYRLAAKAARLKAGPYRFRKVV